MNNNTNSVEDQQILKLINKLEDDSKHTCVHICGVGVYNNTSFYKNAEGNFNIEFHADESISADCLFNKNLYIKIDDSKIIVNSYRILSIREEFHSGDIKVIVAVDAFNSVPNIELLDDTQQFAFCEIKEKVISFQQIGVMQDRMVSHFHDEICYNCIRLKIDNYVFLMYFIKTEEHRSYLVLKSQTKISRDYFLNILESIRTTIGLLSGIYIASDTWCFSKHMDTTGEVAFSYENLHNSLNNGHPIIDSNRYKNCSEYEHMLNAEQFNSLVNLLYHNKEIERATILLIQAAYMNNISKGCLSSVALETIKEIITKPESENILKNDSIQHIVKDLLATLNNYKDSLEKSTYDRMMGQISHLEQPSNEEALRQPFISLGIKLDEEDMSCLKSRNDFLHGRLVKPKKNQLYERLTYAELENTVSNKMIMLTAMLILKKCGYNGKIIDWGYTELIKRRAMLAKLSKCEEGAYLRAIG